MNKRITINVDYEAGRRISDVAKVCGMVKNKLVEIAVSEWELRHCSKGTTSYEELRQIRAKRG